MACEYHGAKEREDEGNAQNVGESVVTGFPNGRCWVIHKNPRIRSLKAGKHRCTQLSATLKGSP